METDRQGQRCKQTKKRKVHDVKAVFLFAVRQERARVRGVPRASVWRMVAKSWRW